MTSPPQKKKKNVLKEKRINYANKNYFYLNEVFLFEKNNSLAIKSYINNHAYHKPNPHKYSHKKVYRNMVKPLFPRCESCREKHSYVRNYADKYLHSQQRHSQRALKYFRRQRVLMHTIAKEKLSLISDTFRGL